jgi:hypothetical protein
MVFAQPGLERGPLGFHSNPAIKPYGESLQRIVLRPQDHRVQWIGRLDPFGRSRRPVRRRPARALSENLIPNPCREMRPGRTPPFLRHLQRPPGRWVFPLHGWHPSTPRMYRTAPGRQASGPGRRNLLARVRSPPRPNRHQSRRRPHPPAPHHAPDESGRPDVPGKPAAHNTRRNRQPYSPYTIT